MEPVQGNVDRGKRLGVKAYVAGLVDGADDDQAPRAVHGEVLPHSGEIGGLEPVVIPVGPGHRVEEANLLEVDEPGDVPRPP